MPHTRHRTWIDIQKKIAGFHHPQMRHDLDADWAPNADVIEHAGGLLVRIELAGVDPGSVQLTATAHALMVHGLRKNPDAAGGAEGRRFRQMEIEYGPFERVLPLPFPVDQGKAKARMVQGLLEIELPRGRVESKPEKVIKLQW
jgi:HSP20 family protein